MRTRPSTCPPRSTAAASGDTSMSERRAISAPAAARARDGWTGDVVAVPVSGCVAVNGTVAVLPGFSRPTHPRARTPGTDHDEAKHDRKRDAQLSAGAATAPQAQASGLQRDRVDDDSWPGVHLRAWQVRLLTHTATSDHKGRRI